LERRVTLKSKRDIWLEEYEDVVQTGRVGKADAKNKLALAQRNIARADRNLEVDADEALINSETAIVNAADAVLAKDGYRIRGKTKSHEARMRYPELPPEFAEEAALVERARSLRSSAMYDQPDFVSKQESAEMLRVARKLVAAVSAKMK
jgi:hypothetical protein